MRTVRRIAAALACGGLLGCQALTLDDPNRPSLFESLNSIENIEISTRTAMTYMFGAVIMGQSVNFRAERGEATFAPAIDGLADAMTFGRRTNTLAATAVIDEPRTEIDHRPESFTVNRAPYHDAYAAISICHDVRRQIFIEGWRDFTNPNWRRAAFTCKLVMGLGHLYLGTMFDKAILIPDDFQPINYENQAFVSHDSVVEFAKTLIREGIREALDTLGSTGVPSAWWMSNGGSYTNLDMAKIGYGYLARAEVWKAITPEQRRDINDGGLVRWQKVIDYADSSIASTWQVGSSSQNFPANVTGGITGQNLTVRGNAGTVGSRNASLFNLMSSEPRDYFRMDHEFLGQADTTGAYVTWLRLALDQRHDTVYASPDRRLPRGPFVTGQAFRPRHTVTTLETALADDGNYFQLLAGVGVGQLQMSSSITPTPGHRKSSYQFIRFGANAAARRGLNSSTSIVYTDWQPIMTKEELALLKAEALIRLNRPLEAIPIINTTRTAATKGGLPAIPASGVAPTGTLPRCVPRSFVDPTQCGSLMDAMLYEKRMEAIGTDMFVNWADWRAFGYLKPGSVVLFPPSFRETQSLGLPYYTYGGSLPGSVDSPNPCPSAQTWQGLGCVNYTSVRKLPP